MSTFIEARDLDLSDGAEENRFLPGSPLMSDSRKKLSVLEKENEELKKNVKRLTEQLRSVSETAETFDMSPSSLDTVCELEGQLAEQTERNETLAREKKGVEGQIKDLFSRISVVVGKRIGNVSDALAGLGVCFHKQRELISRLEATTATLERVEAENIQLHRQMSRGGENAEKKKLARDLDKVMSKLSRAVEGKTRLKEQLDAVSAKNDRRRRDLSTATKQIKTMAKLLDERDGEIERLSAESGKSRGDGEVNQGRKSMDESKDEIIEELTSRSDVLIRAISNFVTFVRKVGNESDDDVLKRKILAECTKLSSFAAAAEVEGGNGLRELAKAAFSVNGTDGVPPVRELMTLVSVLVEMNTVLLDNTEGVNGVRSEDEGSPVGGKSQEYNKVKCQELKRRLKAAEQKLTEHEDARGRNISEKLALNEELRKMTVKAETRKLKIGALQNEKRDVLDKIQRRNEELEDKYKDTISRLEKDAVTAREEYRQMSADLTKANEVRQKAILDNSQLHVAERTLRLKVEAISAALAREKAEADGKRQVLLISHKGVIEEKDRVLDDYIESLRRLISELFGKMSNERDIPTLLDLIRSCIVDLRRSNACVKCHSMARKIEEIESEMSALRLRADASDDSSKHVRDLSDRLSNAAAEASAWESWAQGLYRQIPSTHVVTGSSARSMLGEAVLIGFGRRTVLTKLEILRAEKRLLLSHVDSPGLLKPTSPTRRSSIRPLILIIFFWRKLEKLSGRLNPII